MSLGEFQARLTAAALLGTERQAPPSAAGTPLADLLLENPSREEALLNAAALAQGYLEAGYQPPQSPHPPVAPAPPDPWRVPSEPQQRVFREVLERRQDLLPELLGLMAEAQVRPPPGWLPHLVKEGHFKPPLRPLALRVLGERGRWAARFLEHGAWVTPSSLPDSIWDEGGLGERVAYLRELRGRDPGAARARLEQTWNGETPEARAKLLEAFAVGLSLEDEAFLEAALDDRRKEVRGVAVGLLGGMRESRLTRRMIARVEPLLNFKPAGLLGLKKAELEVSLPEKFEKEWARDGVEQKNVPYGMGEKAWWLQQLLEGVPPDRWRGAKELYQAAGKEWKALIYQSIVGAAARFGDGAAAAQILEITSITRNPADLPKLLPHLSPKERSSLALEQLKRAEPLNNNVGWQVLEWVPQPWDEAIREGLADRFRASFEQWNKNHWEASYFLPTFATRVPIGMIPKLTQILKGIRGDPLQNPEHGLSETVRTFVETLEFRRRMHGAFGASEGAR